MGDDERRAWRQWPLRLAAALALIAALLYGGSGPLLTALGSQLVHADSLERVDAMIVLAPWLERVMEAADVYRRGYAPLIVLTREVRDPAEQILIDRGIAQSGEERRRQILQALGVPADAIVVLDGFVGSTADEALAFAAWARSRPIGSVMVVTSPPHTARSRLTFLRALENLDIEVIVRPATLGRFRSDTWWHSRGGLRDGLLEWQKLAYYRLVELPRLVPPPPAAH